jgi:hypothetical protein
VLGVPHRRAHLGKLLDRVANLLVQDASVGHHDDGIEDRLAVVHNADQLVGQPGDGVGFATAGRMLDEIPPSRAVFPHIREQLAHHVELVVAGEDLPSPLLPGPGVFLLNELRVIFEDVG